MIFTLIADTHNQHRNLEIEATDFLIIAGDYSSQNGEKYLRDFVSWLNMQPAKHKILINGNHDRYYYRHPEKFMEIIGKEIIFLENESIVLEGIKFWGSPLTVPIIDGMYNEVQQPVENRKVIWKTIPDDTDVIITHSPPFGINDNTGKGPHGCKGLLKRVLEIKPKYHLFGHIHQQYGETYYQGIRFKNGTLVDDTEQIKRRPIVFEY